MCNQDTCVYLLSAASTVIRNKNHYLYIARATFTNLFLVYIYSKSLVTNIVIKIQNQVTQHFLLENHNLYPVETSRKMVKKADNYSCGSIRITLTLSGKAYWTDPFLNANCLEKQKVWKSLKNKLRLANHLVSFLLRRCPFKNIILFVLYYYIIQQQASYLDTSRAPGSHTAPSFLSRHIQGPR